MFRQRQKTSVPPRLRQVRNVYTVMHVKATRTCLNQVYINLMPNFALFERFLPRDA